jgi:hypothetical protein
MVRELGEDAAEARPKEPAPAVAPKTDRANNTNVKFFMRVPCLGARNSPLSKHFAASSVIEENTDRAAAHQELFADHNHLDQLGWVAVEVDHVSRVSLAYLNPGRRVHSLDDEPLPQTAVRVPYRLRRFEIRDR